MFRTGYILSGRTDAFVFLTLPLLAIAVAFWSQGRLPAAAEASVALWITIPHHFATWLRTYGFSDERTRWRVQLLIGPFIILGVTLAGLRIAPVTVLLLVFLWDHQHSIMQQYGFARIYDFKAGTGAPTTGRFDFWLNWMLYLNLFLASPLWTRIWLEMLYQWGLTISAEVVSTIHFVSWTGTGVFACLYMRHVVQSIRSGHRINPIKYVFIGVSYALWYVMAWFNESLISHLLAHRIMHGVQYIVIVYSYIDRKAERTSVTKGILSRLRATGGVPVFLALSAIYAIAYVLIVGDGLEQFALGYEPFEWAFDSVKDWIPNDTTFSAGYDYFAYAVTQSVAVTHYYFDSFIWKVRDTRTQAGL